MRSAAAVRGSPEVQSTDGNQLRAAEAQGGPNPSTAEIGRKPGSDGGALVAARFREHEKNKEQTGGAFSRGKARHERRRLGFAREDETPTAARCGDGRRTLARSCGRENGSSDSTKIAARRELGTRLWRRDLGETSTHNPSARRVRRAGPQRSSETKPNGNPPRTKIGPRSKP
jgi:hypothetical protein